MLLELQSLSVPANYISPAWEIINYKVYNTHDATLVISKYYLSPKISGLNKDSRIEYINLIISVYWLIGFIEAVGDFVIRNESSKYIIEFKIKTKSDALILYLINVYYIYQIR